MALKKTLVKILSVLIAAFLIIGTIPIADLPESKLAVEAGAAVYGGKCGPNATWTLDNQGNMVISGTGAITTHPWWTRKENYFLYWVPIYDYDINTLVIEDGITDICEVAFRCCPLKHIFFGNTIKNIGIAAFESCDNLDQDQLVIPKSVEKISGASLSCKARSLIICNPLCKIVDAGTIDGNQEGHITSGIYSNNYRGTVYGYENSTAQDYCKQVGSKFLSIGNCLIDDNKDNFILDITKCLLLEYGTLEKVEDATINYDESDLYIIKDGYYSVNIHKCTLVDTEKPTFALVPENTESHISAVHCNGKDALIEDCSIGISNTSLSGKAFNIKIYSDPDAEIEQYNIIQNGKIMFSNNSGEFLLDPKTIPAGTELKVSVIDKNGQKYKPLKTNIKTYEASTTLDVSGKKISVNLPGEIPIIGGADFTIDLSTLPIFVMSNEHSVRIGIGASEKYNRLDGKTVSTTPVGTITTENNKTSTSSLWQDWKKTVDDAVYDLKALNVASAFDAYNDIGNLKCESDSFAPKGNAKACAYAEFTLDDYGKLNAVESNGILAVDMSVAKDWQTLVWGIPFVIGVSGKIGADCEMNVGFDFEHSEWYADSDLSFTIPSVSGKAGPGLAKVVELTAYAKITNTLNTSFVSKYLSGVLNGELGVSGKFLCFSGEKSVWKFLNWQYLYTTWGDAVDTVKEQKKYCTCTPEKNLYSIDSYKVDPSTHLAKQSDWYGNKPIISTFSTENMTSQEMDKLLQKSICETANPQTVITSDGIKVLTWIADINERSAENHPALVYSVFNKETSLWSAPKIVSDDGTTDGYHNIATDGNDIYVTWVNVNKVFDENITLPELAKACEISVAHFNKENLTFEEPICVTDNEVMDLIPSVCVKDGSAYVSYISNNDSDPLTLTGVNNIGLAVIDSQQKVENSYVMSTDKPVYKVASGFINDELTIAYLGDVDGSVETVEDIELFTVNNKSETKKITDNNLQEQNVGFGIINGRTALTYSVEGEICYSYDLTEIKNTNIITNGNYQFIDFTDTSLLIYTFQNSEKLTEDIYASVYCPDGWSKPVLFKSCDQDIKYFSACKDINSISLIYTPVEYENDIKTENQNGKTEGTFTENLDLYASDEVLFTDINLLYINYDRNKVVPGAVMPITLLVRNDGLTTVSKLNLVTDNNVSVDLSCNIKPGQVQKINTELTVPDTLSTVEEINLSINTEDNDRNPENNSKKIKIGYTCLSLSFAEYSSDKNQSFSLIISNDGGISTGYKIILHKDSYTGKIVNSFTVNNIDPYSEQAYYIDNDLLKKYYDVGETVYVEIQSLKEEYDTSDNFAFLGLIEENKTEDYEYRLLSDDKIEIISYNGNDSDVVVPEIYDGCIVSRFGADVFGPEIKTVTLPLSTDFVNGETFKHADSLEKINIDPKNEHFCSDDGILFSKDKSEIVKIPSAMDIETYIIPKETDCIGKYAFSGCTLREITLSDDIDSIKNCAFYGCNNLRNVTVTGKEINFWDDAFENCNSLTVYCYNNSTAYEYCKENGIDYELISLDAESIEIRNQKNLLFMGGEYKFDAVLETSYTDETLVWTSSNKDIVDIDNTGRVNLKNIGETRLTVSSSRNSVSKSFDVKVADLIPDATGLYHIYTPEDMLILHEMVACDWNFADKTIVLEQDIDLTAYKWEPVGENYDFCFSGIFNGNNHKITYNYNNTQKSFSGLFGVVKRGAIINLTVDGSVQGNVTTTGVIAGELSDSIMSNCRATGTVFLDGISNSFFGENIGGLVGRSKNSTIVNCASEADIDVNIRERGSSFVGLFCKTNIGGIVGRASADSDALCVLNSYCSGDISVSKRHSGRVKKDSIGGIVGYLNDAAINNYYYGNIVDKDIDPDKNIESDKNIGYCFGTVSPELNESDDKIGAEKIKIEKNYYLEGKNPIGKTDENYDMTDYTTAIKKDNFNIREGKGSLVDILNSNREYVDNTISEKVKSQSDNSWTDIIESVGIDEIQTSSWKLGPEIIPVNYDFVCTEHIPEKEWIIDQKPSCTEEGSKHQVCLICGATINTTAIEKLPHTEEIIPGKAPTCTEDGLTDGKKCSVCGEILVEQKIIPKTPHIDENLDNICDVCGATIKECHHICHSKNPFLQFIWRIINFFNKLFGINQYCSCGAKHW